jgi:glycosyltransferase involved in cell wall biosynthesis
MNSPFFTCLVLSHDKPEHVVEAIASICSQSFSDWEAIVFDSGLLYDQGFFTSLPAMADPRIRLIRSWETEELRRTRTIASWCFNECLRKKLVRGSFVTYLCDDDLLDPGAYSAFYQHIQQNPGTMALYGSVDMSVVNRIGEKFLLWQSPAREIKGRCCHGGVLDKTVDYLQFCHHIEVLKVFPDTEFWPEDREAMRHADGLFMERIGEHFPIFPVPARIGENRKVPQSLNDGGENAERLAEQGRTAQADRRLREQLGIVGRILIRSGVVGWWRSLIRACGRAQAVALTGPSAARGNNFPSSARKIRA